MSNCLLGPKLALTRNLLILIGCDEPESNGLIRMPHSRSRVRPTILIREYRSMVDQGPSKSKTTGSIPATRSKPRATKNAKLVAQIKGIVRMHINHGEPLDRVKLRELQKMRQWPERLRTRAANP